MSRPLVGGAPLNLALAALLKKEGNINASLDT